MTIRYVKCPQCDGPLVRVVQGSGYLNRDQFDAVKAGDWYCTRCPDNGRGQSGLCYWSDNEVVKPDEPKSVDVDEAMKGWSYALSWCWGFVSKRAETDALKEKYRRMFVEWENNRQVVLRRLLEKEKK